MKTLTKKKKNNTRKAKWRCSSCKKDGVTELAVGIEGWLPARCYSSHYLISPGCKAPQIQAMWIGDK